MFILPFLFTTLAQEPLRVPPDVQEKKLIEKVEPVYPELAKAHKIAGTVIFSVHIGKDGTITDSKLISGHPLLVPAAAEALKKFAYEPTIFRGEAVEVVTQVRFYFAGPQPAPTPHPPHLYASRVRMAPEFAAQNLIKKVEPALSPDAAHIHGTVRFNIVIAWDGTIQSAELVSGHPILATSAMEAVKQYVYKQALLNDAPMEVVTAVDVVFQ
jgi:TonB family protein